MALRTIGLSFKNTQEDKELYDWLYTHSNLSGFIKDVLRKEMLQGGDKKPPRRDKNNIGIDF